VIVNPESAKRPAPIRGPAINPKLPAVSIYDRTFATSSGYSLAAIEKPATKVNVVPSPCNILPTKLAARKISPSKYGKTAQLSTPKPVRIPLSIYAHRLPILSNLSPMIVLPIADTRAKLARTIPISHNARPFSCAKTGKKGDENVNIVFCKK